MDTECGGRGTGRVSPHLGWLPTSAPARPKSGNLAISSSRGVLARVGGGGRPEGKILTLLDVMSGGGERGHRAQFGRLSVPSRAGGETRALRRASPRRPQGGPCADLLAGARNFAPGSRDEPNNKHIASAAPVRQPIPGQPTRNPFPPNRPPALARQSPPRLRSSTLARRHSQWDPARVPTSPRSSRMT